MAKTETNVSTLKINRGTYAKVQENLSSITENELIITSDKNVPIPTTNDNGKAVVVNASGEYELGTIEADYPVHSYTANTTYTGDDLTQLRDDITHFRMIKIGSDVYHCIYAQTNATYWYVQTYNVSSTIYMNKVTIDYNTGSVSAITQSEVTSGLPTTGGTMTGAIKGPSGTVLKDSDNGDLLFKTSMALNLGKQTGSNIYLKTDTNNHVYHTKNTTDYEILDASNTSANPTLSGGEATLSSLKLNGTNYAVPTPHTINTYTLGALSEADQAKIANDIANGYPIKVGNTIYELFSDTQYWVYWLSRVDGTYTRGDYNKVSYSKTNHQLSTNSGNDNILFSSDILSTLPISNGLTINGHTRKFGTDSIGYRTTAPTADNTSGYLGIVQLTSEPATRYNGYLYIITA